MFVPFRERSPKYLDPTSSYSNDETPFTYQVYEPLYGYHYLKRPYELNGRTAEEVARPRYLDKDGNVLADDAPGDQVAETVFEVRIKPGIKYAPHPAFAKNASGEYVYHSMKRRTSPTSTRSRTSRKPGRASSSPTTTSTRSAASPRRASSRRRSRRCPTTSSASRSTARRSSRSTRPCARTSRRPIAICRCSISASIRSPAPRRSTPIRFASA